MPAMLAALISGLAFLSVLAYHDVARWVGIGWMAFGLLFYVVYRKVFEETTLTKRVSVTEQALTKQAPEVAFRNILVPVFGTELDDDIVATAGRLAAAEQEEAEASATTPTSTSFTWSRFRWRCRWTRSCRQSGRKQARRALGRAKQVGEEYEDVEVSAELVRARNVGAGIVEAARRSGAEAIVVGGEPPTKIRGGATLGGIGAAKPAEIGAATEYVLKKSPCRVLLTAPPETVPASAAQASAAD